MSCNRLCGSKCFENKRILGLLLNHVPGCLKTYSIGSFEDLELFWALETVLGTVWVLKDANANGAAGVWFLHRNQTSELERARQILLEKRTGTPEFCLQEFCPGPLLLWEGRKTHFRITGVVCSNGRAFIHRLAFLHPANKSFDSESLDLEVQLTNLCFNRSTGNPDFLGEIIVDLLDRFPQIYEEAKLLWRKVVDVAFTTLLCHQRAGGRDFEYVGMDIMANELNQVFLLEINSPPAYISATKRKDAEDVHLSMLGDLFRFIVAPSILNLVPDKGNKNWAGGFEEIFTSKILSITEHASFHLAQAKCDILLIQFLMRERRAKKLLEI